MQKCVVLFSLVYYLCGSRSWKSPSLKWKSSSIVGSCWRVKDGAVYTWRRSWGERWSSRFKGPSTFLPSSGLTNFGSWLKVHSSGGGSVTWEELRVIRCSSSSRGSGWGGLGSCIRCPSNASFWHVPLGRDPGEDPKYTGGSGILPEEPEEVSSEGNLGVPSQMDRPTTW